MNLEGYLFVSAIVFSLGLAVFVSRRNSIAILMGVELVINAAALNFVAFSKFAPSQNSQLDGQLFAVFVILLAAAEAVVALAIVLALYRERKHIRADELVSLHG